MKLRVEDLRSRISSGTVRHVWAESSWDLNCFRLRFKVLDGEGPKAVTGTLRPHHRDAVREFNSLRAVWKCAESAGWAGNLEVRRVESFDD